MAPNDFYAKNIFEKFGYIANWFPNSKINLGDIGVMDGYNFKQISSLDESKLNFTIRDSEKSVDFSYSFQAELTSEFNAKVEVLNSIEAGGLKINFTNSGSFVFEATNCVVTQIENKLTLGEEIKKLYKNNNWQLEWVIIDTIITSGSSTILISNSNNSELELSASANIPKISLTDAGIGLKIKSQKGELTKFIAAQGLSPLFKTSKVKSSFLSRLTRRKDDARFGGHNVERNTQDYVEDDMWEKIIF